MFSLFAVVLVALVAAKAAAVAVVAQVTNPIHSENTHGEVPAPTPGPAIAKAGLRRENGIFRRALSLNTCGYVDRVENFAIYCESGLDCACRYQSGLTNRVVKAFAVQPNSTR